MGTGASTAEPAAGSGVGTGAGASSVQLSRFLAELGPDFKRYKQMFYKHSAELSTYLQRLGVESEAHRAIIISHIRTKLTAATYQLRPTLAYIMYCGESNDAGLNVHSLAKKVQKRLLCNAIQLFYL
mgnify:CR=1 FL=1